VEDIGGFYRECLETMERSWRREKNPEILRQRLRVSAGTIRGGLMPLIIRYLKSESYRNRLASAAVAAIRMLDEPQFIKALGKELKAPSGDWRDGGSRSTRHPGVYRTK